MFRMSLLEIIAFEFIAWNLSSDSKYWHSAAMTIVETVNEMEIAWTAASSAH
jgi:hypothetical protein